jgi:DNA modification methylase
MDAKIEKAKLKIEDIKPNPKNPKKHSDDLIEQSIKEFGVVAPIIVDENNMVLAGHGRLNALIKLGYKEIEVIVKKGLTEEQKEKYMLIDNKLTERGGWDAELLKEFDIGDLLEAGFEADDLNSMWDDILELYDDNFDVEKAIREIKKPTVKDGELYQLGDHRLLCADSTKEKSIEILMGKEKAAMIYCDPPYNIGLNYDTGFGTSTKYRKNFPDLKYKGVKDNKKTPEYKTFLDATIKNALRAANPDAHIFYWCDENYIWLLQQLYRENKIHQDRVCLWIKNNFNVTPQIAFNKVYEACVYGKIGKPYLNKNFKTFNEILNKEIESGNQGLDEILEMINIWMVRRDNTLEYQHPTQKPITLHEKPIKRCTKPGDIILDLFGGSGSTLISAEQTKRIAYICEIDPIFCEVIIKRFEQYSGKKAVKLVI